MFYELVDVPIHSVTLVSSRDQALDFPRGDILLGGCLDCRFIHNTAFDAKRLTYHSEYESTQSYSATFNAFHHDLARRLVERYDLHDKKLIEIGCGHGEFLALLCSLGNNDGVGFDPAYRPSRNTTAGLGRTTFIADYYSQRYAHHRGDFICCKMTLEHIPDTAGFLRDVRASLDAQAETMVFFQVPNAQRVLSDTAFWDIYYEHCSYFTAASLRYLFCANGFEVIDTSTEYNDQYLMIEARPDRAHAGVSAEPPSTEAEFRERLAGFTYSAERLIDDWHQTLRALQKADRRIVVWGGGSKAVAFLTTLGVHNAIEYAVDINPHKQGTFLAGGGQAIVAPAFLKDYRPDTIIVMNPVYCREIERQLDHMGITAELMPLGPTHRPA